jgi:hypothetical protein
MQCSRIYQFLFEFLQDFLYIYTISSMIEIIVYDCKLLFKLIKILMMQLLLSKISILFMLAK